MTKNENTYTVGVIAEYNPFHNGHAYHIQKAKELAHASCAVVALSGDFTQRGAPAIFDKYTRAAMALQCGADLVLELPQVFATGSAEDFASCGVGLLDSLGVVDSLCFGAECSDLSKFTELAGILADEPPEFSAFLKKELKNGAAYPRARQNALLAAGYTEGTDAALLSSPNNILGIEYCRALHRRKSLIRPIVLPREESGYHDKALSETYSSATAIREALKKQELSSLKTQVPFPVYSMLEQALPLYQEDFSELLNAALLRNQKDGIALSDYLDVSSDLAARIGRSVLEFSSFEDRIQALKTRQYTYTRISRALLHILLGIRGDDAVRFRDAGYAPYARVLGFRKSSAALLSAIKQKSRIPLITKTADAVHLLDGAALSMLTQDMYGSHLYQSVYYNKYHRLLKNEFTRSVIICG